MSGGYVSCGGFHGDDKSCSAFRGVLDQIVSLPSYNPDTDLQRFIERLRSFLSGEGDAEWSDYLLISPQQAIDLEPYLAECSRSLVADLGTEDPFEAIEKDKAVPGLDPIEAKWGKGKGWRLYCVTDLLRVIALSRTTGEVICIAFD